MTSPITRSVALVAWAAAAFSFVCIILINVGGVSRPINLTARSHLGNPGFELLQWYLAGEGDESVSNYYHYRLYLNRICAVNPSQSRGLGDCFTSGILGFFHLSRGDPDAFVHSQNHYDPILGHIDFLTPFVSYLLAAIVLFMAIIKIPASIVAGQSNPLSIRHLKQSQWASYTMVGAASCLLIASTTLTVTLVKTHKRMELLPEISHIWKGGTSLGLTWAATVSCIVSACALSLKAMFAQSSFERAQRHMMEKQRAYEKQFFSKSFFKYDDKILEPYTP